MTFLNFTFWRRIPCWNPKAASYRHSPLSLSHLGKGCLAVRMLALTNFEYRCVCFGLKPLNRILPFSAKLKHHLLSAVPSTSACDPLTDKPLCVNICLEVDNQSWVRLVSVSHYTWDKRTSSTSQSCSSSLSSWPCSHTVLVDWSKPILNFLLIIQTGASSSHLLQYGRSPRSWVTFAVPLWTVFNFSPDLRSTDSGRPACGANAAQSRVPFTQRFYVHHCNVLSTVIGLQNIILIL